MGLGQRSWLGLDMGGGEIGRGGQEARYPPNTLYGTLEKINMELAPMVATASRLGEVELLLKRGDVD